MFVSLVFWGWEVLRCPLPIGLMFGACCEGYFEVLVYLWFCFGGYRFGLLRMFLRCGGVCIGLSLMYLVFGWVCSLSIVEVLIGLICG